MKFKAFGYEISIEFVKPTLIDLVLIVLLVTNTVTILLHK